MATGGETSYSCCSSCLDDGRNTVARHYCVECEMYFCTKCVKYHNKMPSLKAHQVNDVNSSDSTDVDDDTTSLQSDVPSDSSYGLRCTLHQGKPIDTHCKDHDEVCCEACAIVKHRACTTVTIAIAAKDFKTSPKLDTCKEALTECIVKYTDEKKNRTENRDRIDARKLELIETVDKYEEKIIENIKKLANISRTEIRDKCEEHKADLDKDIAALDVVISSATKHVDKLEQADDEALFLLAKTSKTVTNDGEVLLQVMSPNYGKREIKLYFDESFDNIVHELESFCTLDIDLEVTLYKATLQTNVNVKRSNETENVRIFDMCLMSSGELLITDEYNNKLKRFNAELKFIDDIQLSGKPAAVCAIDQNLAALRIWNTKVVHTVSVGDSMQLTSSFTLVHNGYGMTYDASSGKIFACENDQVSVYSKTGNKLRTYYCDTEDENIFSDCRQIALSANKHDIYVTDITKGLIILDKKSGLLKTKVSIPGIDKTWPLCLLPDGVCLAGGMSSCVIVQTDKDGKHVETLIDTNQTLRSTFCVVYDCKQSILIVGGSSNEIYVYKLQGHRRC